MVIGTVIPPSTADAAGETGALGGRWSWLSYRRAVLANTLLSILITLPVLSRLPFWRDEAFSAVIAGDPATLEWQIIRKREASMGLYYELLHFWMFLGRSEFTIRLLSLIVAAAAIPVTMAVARRLFGERVAMLSGLVMATNTFYLTWAKEARSYAFVVFFSALTAWCLLRLLENHTVRRQVAYVASATVLCYMHPLALLVLIGQAVGVLLLTRQKATFRRLLPSWIATIILVVPIGIYVFVVQKSMTNWVPPTTVRILEGFGSDIAGNIPLEVVYFLALVSLIPSLRRSRETAFVAAWGVLPVVMLVAAGLVKNVFVDRYLAGIIPAVAILIAVALTRLRLPRPAYQKAVYLILAVLVIQNIADRIWTRGPAENLRSAAELVQQQAHAGDAITFAPAYARVGFDYYANRIGGVAPQDIAIAPGGTIPQVGDEFPRELSADQLAQRLLRYSKLWILSYPDPLNVTPEPMFDLKKTWLPRHFTEISHKTYGGITVTQYQRK